MFRPGSRSTVASRVASRGSDCGSNFNASFNASLNTSFNMSVNSACDDIEAARPPSHRHATPPPPSLAATVGLRGAACACVCVLGVLALAGGGAPSRSAAAAASQAAAAEPRDLLKETRVLRRPAQVERLRRVYERTQGGGGGGGGGSKEELREAAEAAEEDEELREEDDDDLGGGGGGGGGGGSAAAVSNEAALAARRWSQQRQQEQSLRWVVRQSYPEWLGAHGAAAAAGSAHRQSSRDAVSDGGGLLSDEGLALFRRWSEAYAAYSGAGGRRDLRLAVTFTNNAYIEEGLLPNLVCSLQRLGIQWYVIVATDEKAAAALARMGPEFAEHTHWDAEYWRGTASHALRSTYNSTEDYVAFIRRRTNFTKGLLETLHAQNEQGRGKARSSTVEEVVVTDGDTVWMQDPLHAVAKVVEHLRAADKLRAGGAGTGHLKRLGCDGYAVNDVNHGAAATEKRLRTEPVGGFLVWKVNARVVRLYRRWVDMMRCLGSREQPALHAALSLMNAYVARPASWLNVHLAEKLHLRGSAAGQPIDLFLCTLPDVYFPTSLHLSMRATAAGPVSDYLSDYGLAAPREVARSLAVAHANIKYKSHDNKMTWFSQFHLNLWDQGKAACRARKGPAAPLAEPRFGREPAGRPLGGGGKAQRMLYRGVAHAGRGLGWAKQEDGTWVQNMERYLEAHHSPWERWETCRVSYS